MQFLKGARVEGDDGLYAATERLRLVPDYMTRMAAATSDCAADLDFKVGPWQTLHFCGNTFKEVGGTLIRTRDTAAVIAKIQCLHGAESCSTAHDCEQQRSKALAVLAGPWVPIAGAFCAVIERLTRTARVSEKYAVARGWLREWQPYALEG